MISLSFGLGFHVDPRVFFWIVRARRGAFIYISRHCLLLSQGEPSRRCSVPEVCAYPCVFARWACRRQHRTRYHQELHTQVLAESCFCFSARRAGLRLSRPLRTLTGSSGLVVLHVGVRAPRVIFKVRIIPAQPCSAKPSNRTGAIRFHRNRRVHASSLLCDSRR